MSRHAPSRAGRRATAAAQRRKPATPDEIAARRLAQRRMDLEAVNLPPELATLEAGEAVVVTRKGPNSIEGARREDVFQALRKGMAPGAFDAARRFEKDLLTSFSLNDRGRAMLRVDGDAGHDPAGRIDRMLMARARLNTLADHLPAGIYTLLQELITPMGPARPWREVVRVMTGEVHAHAQGAVVRQACDALRWGWERVEGRGRG